MCLLSGSALNINCVVFVLRAVHNFIKVCVELFELSCQQSIVLENWKICGFPNTVCPIYDLLIRAVC